MTRQSTKAPSKAPARATAKTFGDLGAGSTMKPPTAEELGGRIVDARKRHSITQAGLARATGLSRTVVNGYEKGRHLPGARELALICGALRSSANELLYGVADPFAQSATDWEPEAATLQLIVLASALERSERDAAVTLLRSLVQYRHGRESVQLIDKLMPGVREMFSQLGPHLARHLEKTPIGPAMQAAIQEAEGGHGRQRSAPVHGRRQKAAAKRAR